MLQEGQEYPIGMVRISGREQADAVFPAGRQHGMGKGYLAVVQHDYCNVFKWHTGGLLLLYGERVMISLEPGRAGDDDATPNHVLQEP